MPQAQYSRPLYHFTDMSNLVSIFEQRNLLARSLLVNLDISFRDVAREQILEERLAKRILDALVLEDYVPLLFCRRSRMLFGVEGIKLVKDGKPHCPHPILLTFEPSVLLIPGVLISDQWAGNPDAKIGYYPDGLAIVDFSIVDDPYAHRLHATKQKMHAEVLVPWFLPITHLKKVIVRSQAELCQLLSIGYPVDACYDSIEYRVCSDFFHCQRPFVEYCIAQKIRRRDWLFKFVIRNIQNEEPQVVLCDLDGFPAQELSWERSRELWEVKLRNIEPERVNLQIYLDRQLILNVRFSEVILLSKH